MRRKVYDGCVGGFVGVCPLALLLPFMTISNFDKLLADDEEMFERMKRSTPYYFKEAGLTIWLTASQYCSLRKRFEDLAGDGSVVAAARLQGFGPAPDV